MTSLARLSVGCLCVLLACSSARGATPEKPKPDSVLQVMSKVADWQLANPTTTEPGNGWQNSVFYMGVMALIRITSDKHFEEKMLEMGNQNHWHLGSRVYHADDQAVGQTYADLYLLDGKPEQLQQMRQQMDFILANPSPASLDRKDPKRSDRWSWCDALFMAPSVWGRLSLITHDEKYLTFADHEWQATSEHLYDKSDHLFYRDDSFLAARDAAGQKIFWARGNGWVVAGIARLLPLMPKNYPSRSHYITQYHEMTGRLKDLQLASGFWPMSLLDPSAYPEEETSGTGLFCYAFAWGINNGLLDRKEYEPLVLKAWAALNQHVAADGRLDGVEPRGASPAHFPETDTHPYGVGAFLLAGSEVYRLLENDSKPQ